MLSRLGLGFLAVLVLTACDSGSSNSVVIPTAFNTIEGVASKGIIAAGDVTVIDSVGNRLAVTAVTENDGSYSLRFSPELVARGISTPLQVVVSSDGAATSICDADLDATGDNDCFNGFDSNGVAQFVAFGETLTLDNNFTMRAVIAELPSPTDSGAAATVNPTPLTEVATSLALGTGTTLTSDQVNDANGQVLAIIGAVTGADVTNADLNSIPVVNAADATAISGASELSLASAGLSASILTIVDPADTTLDSVGEALSSVSSDISAGVQASGNSSALPSETLSDLASGTSTVVDRLFGLNQAVSALSGLRTQVATVARTLEQVPADVDAVITPGSSEIDLGDFVPTLRNGTTADATINSDLVGEFDLVYSDLSTDSERDPFSDGQEISGVVGSDGSLTLNGATLENPFSRDLGNGINNSEIIWLDVANSIEYALSSNDSGVFNEINIGDAGNPLSSSGVPALLGQLTEVEETTGGGTASPTGTCGDNNSGAITGLGLLGSCAGTYTVTSTDTGTHSRGTIVISEDGSVDFDTDLNFPASQAPTVFDRLSIENAARIQANYGADDDGPVIQLFFDSMGVLVQISYRNRTDSVEIVANVTLN